MIINHSSCNMWELYKITGITFNQNKDWSFRLLSLVGELSSPLTKAGIYELSTNLIHRDEGNSSGVIGYMYLNHDDSSITFQPTQVPCYKLRFPDLCYSLFNLRSVGSSVYIRFKTIALQIEIKETYGGV
jgi:hypothetical protein